jgi:hypothetical protein
MGWAYAGGQQEQQENGQLISGHGRLFFKEDSQHPRQPDRTAPSVMGKKKSAVETADLTIACHMKNLKIPVWIRFNFTGNRTVCV